MASGGAVRYLTRHGGGRVARLVLLAPTTPFVLKRPTMRMASMPGCSQSAETNGGVISGAGFLRTPRRTSAMRSRAARSPRCCAIGRRPRCSQPRLRQRSRSSTQPSRLIPGRSYRPLPLPTLVVQGDADASAPLLLTGVRTAELIPNCRLLVYENAPHGLYLTHRAKVNADLLAFIDDHAPVLAA